jgi:hypothetical protein
LWLIAHIYQEIIIIISTYSVFTHDFVLNLIFNTQMLCEMFVYDTNILCEFYTQFSVESYTKNFVCFEHILNVTNSTQNFVYFWHKRIDSLLSLCQYHIHHVKVTLLIDKITLLKVKNTPCVSNSHSCVLKLPCCESKLHIFYFCLSKSVMK